METIEIIAHCDVRREGQPFMEQGVRFYLKVRLGDSIESIINRLSNEPDIISLELIKIVIM